LAKSVEGFWLLVCRQLDSCRPYSVVYAAVLTTCCVMYSSRSWRSSHDVMAVHKQQ